MSELELIEIKPRTRQGRTHWSVQRVTDKYWLVGDRLLPPTFANFKKRRRFKSIETGSEAMLDYLLKETVMAPVLKQFDNQLG